MDWQCNMKLSYQLIISYYTLHYINQLKLIKRILHSVSSLGIQTNKLKKGYNRELGVKVTWKKMKLSIVLIIINEIFGRALFKNSKFKFENLKLTICISSYIIMSHFIWVSKSKSSLKEEWLNWNANRCYSL